MFSLFHSRGTGNISVVKKTKSIVWNFFEKHCTDTTISVCKTCNGEVKTSGNTTNCGVHLQKNHPTVFQTYNKLRLRQQQQLGLVNLTEFNKNDDTPDTETETETEANLMKNRSIKSYLNAKKKKNPYARKNKNKILKDEALGKMCALDYQPYSIVDDPGFIQFCHAMDERYQLPSRNTLANSLIPQLCKKVNSKLAILMADPSLRYSFKFHDFFHFFNDIYSKNQY